jgi:hypothetical protein
MDTVVNLVNMLAPLLSMLVGTGLAVKYLPFLKWFPNEAIKLLNAFLVFFVALGGAVPAPAHAGILGSVANELGMIGKIGISFAVSGMASWFYEKHLRDAFTKLGIKKA